jgi:hypothetical protein
VQFGLGPLLNSCIRNPPFALAALGTASRHPTAQKATLCGPRALSVLQDRFPGPGERSLGSGTDKRPPHEAQGSTSWPTLGRLRRAVWLPPAV